VVGETQTPDFLDRARKGMVGFARVGPLRGRYLLLHVVGDPPEWWSCELSFPVGRDPDVDMTSDLAEPWEEFRKELEAWEVEWCPPSLNRRATHLVFGYDPAEVGSEEPRRRFRSAAGIEPMNPKIPGTDQVPVALSILHADAIFRGIEPGGDSDASARTRSSRFHPDARRARKRMRAMEDLVRELWLHGYGIAIVPLDAAVLVEPVKDPWRPFA
jgi:hypothetical protein